jgi:hypothetical protein
MVAAEYEAIQLYMQLAESTDNTLALEAAIHNMHIFERTGQLDLTGFDGSGSDWMPQYKKYINNGKTYVSSPHKLYGPDSNDTVLQLRKRGIEKIILDPG